MSVVPGSRIEGDATLTTQPAAARASARGYPALGLVRTLAMLSIVAYHVDFEPLLGLAFGLPTLQIVMGALVARRAVAAPFAALARGRARRLLVPFVCWSAIYAAAHVLHALRWGEPPFARFGPWMLLSGTSYHLWFLPYAFCAALVTNRLQHRTQTIPARWLVPGWLGLAVGLALAVVPLLDALDLPGPWELWLLSSPTIPFGLALGRSLAIEDRAAQVRWAIAIALAGCLPVAIGALAGDAHVHYARYAPAVALACAGFAWRPRVPALLARLAGANLGVYLAHVLVLDLVRRILPSDALAVLPMAILVYAICLGMVILARRLRLDYLV